MDISPTQLQRSPTVKLSIDYSSFRHTYGGDWAGRLQVMSFDSCWIDNPKQVGCSKPLPVKEFVNDTEAGVISFEVTADQLGARVVPVGGLGEFGLRLQSTGGPGFGLGAGAYSAGGNFATSDLNPSGKWSVGLQAGSFEYQYPMEVPAPPAGPVPNVGLSYSSQALDGFTSDQNTQGGQVSPGWSMGAMFIERRYKTCADDGGSIGDLCWVEQNATISMNGVSGELVLEQTLPYPLGGWQWQLYRANNAVGWKFIHFERISTGLPGSLGVDDNGEHWEALAPDGVSYWFGYGNRTGAWNPGTALGSVRTVPVVANHAGEPCRAVSGNWCHQAYRWDVDRIENKDGQVANYLYSQEVNYYGLKGSPYLQTPYVSGSRLERIDYGMVTGNASAAANTHQVSFHYEYRCVALTSACAAPTKATSSNYPDIPADHFCDPSAGCFKYSPIFFDRMRLAGVLSWTRSAGSTFVPVDYWIMNNEWNGLDGTERLWLRYINRYSYHYAFGWGGEQVGQVRFDGPSSGIPFPNRVDYNTSAGVTQMRMWRVGKIRDELGSVTYIDYTQPKMCSNPVTSDPQWQGFNSNTWSCFARWWAPPSGAAGFSVWHKYVVSAVTVRDLTGVNPDMVTTYSYPASNNPGIAGLPTTVRWPGMATPIDLFR